MIAVDTSAVVAILEGEEDAYRFITALEKEEAMMSVATFVELNAIMKHKGGEAAIRIVDRFIEEGVKIEGVIALGGVAKKAPFVMQIHADVLNMKIKVARSDQTCALGAAMCAATASGIYPSVHDAQKTMGNGFEQEYFPNEKNAEKYISLYQKYSKLGNFIENEFTK